MIPSGMKVYEANAKLAAIKEASRQAMRHVIGLPPEATLDTLMLNAEIKARWAKFNVNQGDADCLNTQKLCADVASIPTPIVPAAAVPNYPVDQPTPTPRQVGGPKKKHMDNPGD